MIKNSKITFAFIIASVLVGIITGTMKISSPKITEIIGSLLGSLFILFLIPLIITYFIKGIYRLAKSDLVGNAFLTTFAVIWVIIVALTLGGSLLLDRDVDSIGINKSEYVFNPTGCAYTAVFCRKPTIKASAFTLDSRIYKGQYAEVNKPDEGIFERVEFYLMDKSFINIINEDAAYKFLNEFCAHNGLNSPELTYLDNNNEKHAELRAYKNYTDDLGKKGMLTYDVKVYMKGETYFVTNVCAESKYFPTSENIRFLNSVKLSNRE